MTAPHNPKPTINPADFCTVDELLDELLEGVEFSASPFELIAGVLHQSVKVLDTMQCADPADMPHLAEVARLHCNIARTLGMAWDRQQRRGAAA